MQKGMDKTMKKETLIKAAIWIPIIAFCVFLYFKNNEPEQYVPSPLESRYNLNILAKKYEIPLETAREISLRKDKVKNPDGSTDWEATIEYLSRDTGIPQKVISAFLFDADLIENISGNYDDSNYE